MKTILADYVEKLKNNCTKTKIIKRTIIMLIIFLAFDIYITNYLNIDKIRSYIENDTLKNLYEYKIIAGILIIAVIITQLYINRLKIVTKLVNVGNLDINLLVVQISSLIYIITNIQRKTYVLNIILYIFLIAVIIQIIKIISIIFTTKIAENNVVDLREFLDSGFMNKRCFIKEDEPEYDLLGMDRTIQKLYKAISECNTTESFVMSLNGKWGTGKSTLIKNLKRKIEQQDKNIIILDDFNPWIYNNERAVLIGIYENFMQKVGQEVGNKKIKKFFLASLKVVFENTDYEKTFNLVSNQLNSKKEMEYYKNLINTYLRINNKKILFVVDDLDRASKDNILFLLNMIKNVLNFNNTIYLLSFDEEIVKNKLKEEIDCSFLEKIIQMPIQMPKPDTSIKNSLISSAIREMMFLYTLNEKVNYEEYGKEMGRISYDVYDQIKDLRELKRILNSILNYYLYSDFLNIIDIFLIQLIEIKDNELYEEIWKNREWFACKEIDEFEGKEEKSKRTTIFDKIFANDGNFRYIKIVATLFPYVDMYYKSEEYQYKEIEKDDNHIYNIEYTEMYFTEEKTNKFRVNEDIKKIMKNPNIFVETMKSYDSNKQVEFLMTMPEEIFTRNEMKKFLKILAEHAVELADENNFQYIDSIEYMKKIITELNNIEIRKILINQKDLYMLVYLKNILKDNIKKNIIENIILHNRINIMNKHKYIFEDPLYKRNIFALDLENEEIKRNIGKYINKDNIYDFLKNIKVMIKEYSIGIIDEKYLYHIIKIDEVRDIIEDIRDKRVKTKNEKDILKEYESILLYMKLDR